MNQLKASVLVAIFLLGSSGFAHEQVPLLGGRSSSFTSLDFSIAPLNLNRTYRIGDEWGKKPVSNKDLEDVYFARMAKATAKVNRGGTGFLLGLFDNKIVVATNHHVCPSVSACANTTVQFTLLGKTYRASEVFGSWPEIDLALLAINVPEAEAAALLQNASPFRFSTPIRTGDLLVTIGYGQGSNPMGALVGNQDSDCKVFSRTDDFRLMADPDDLNPGPYKAWSFANGCDVSHGDSGSAMMLRETGDVVGIIWTGRIPKSAAAQSSATIDQWLNAQSEDIWKELSYAVPAAKMKEFFQKLLQDPAAPASTVKVLQGMLN